MEREEGGTLNYQQETALRNHCRLGFETFHPRFAYVRGNVSIVLSLNSGYE